MLNEAGEKWIFRVKYGWRDPARSNEIAEAGRAGGERTPPHARERQRHPSEIHTVLLSARKRARMILLNSQGDEERPFKVIPEERVCVCRGEIVTLVKCCNSVCVCVCVCAFDQFINVGNVFVCVYVYSSDRRRDKRTTR